MNLNSISNSELLSRTENLVRQEREILTSVLHHLQEVNRRRLFSYYGFKSLFEFAVLKLGYSNDAAYRRIAAMKLMSEIPEVESKINSGEITLTHLSMAQTLFRQEKKNNSAFNHEQKRDVLKKMAHTTTREAEKITIALSSSPTIFKTDKVKTITEDKIEISFTTDESVQKKIEKLKGYLAYKHPGITIGELFVKLCDLGLSEWDPSKPLKKKSAKFGAPQKTKSDVVAGSSNAADPLEKQSKITTPAEAPIPEESKIQYHSQAQIRRFVFRRANNSCENCQSTFALEVDHIIPKSKGGSSNTENLRLLCKSCNQRAAIAKIGIKTMEKYIT
jgi:hypothetical protein